MGGKRHTCGGQLDMFAWMEEQAPPPAVIGDPITASPRTRCANSACPVGIYPAHEAPAMFGAHKYCYPCQADRRHSTDYYRRLIEQRERQHALRSWPGWEGADDVQAFRIYLGLDAWDIDRLTGMASSAIGQPCEGDGQLGGCAESFRAAGVGPYLIRDIADATIDVIDPQVPPGMGNLQILCRMCNSTKQDKSPTLWTMRRKGFRRWMVAKHQPATTLF